VPGGDRGARFVADGLYERFAHALEIRLYAAARLHRGTLLQREVDYGRDVAALLVELRSASAPVFEEVAVERLVSRATIPAAEGTGASQRLRQRVSARETQDRPPAVAVVASVPFFHVTRQETGAGPLCALA